MLGALVHPTDRHTVLEAGTTPHPGSTLTQRLSSGARATLELMAAALAGEGHRDAAERSGAGRGRPVEVSVRRLPAVVVVLLLGLIVLTAIGTLFVIAAIGTGVAAVLGAVDQRRQHLAIR
ncbi:hypothetical protein SAMN06295974_2916 [Plantibacter flavus]|uniref:Uncharacterized protein n=1 Tax=Plantibacter flavus TaxID=150123 RepID=A0A3N2C5L7_9MICO|nr:hypothetical protein [Plantibacter flavus]ROR82818.1 hypothetical protein EDD42_2914 [Plantibacter flavus]SMG40374.1 hypothetical protein SAMN06295974_2916 [Plantibacter flavus]